LGFVVENGNMGLMARKIVNAAHCQTWEREQAIMYILNNHTWHKRCELYDKIIQNKIFGLTINAFSSTIDAKEHLIGDDS